MINIISLFGILLILLHFALKITMIEEKEVPDIIPEKNINIIPSRRNIRRKFCKYC